ncbi:hypothetical protein TNCV_673051 [Trichonephila clavipes]|uniref:Uncharacterized protein n=1 Tax=Trichonephila clavipes TaxID=2585209 RepID=A0A8X7BIJ6_TRICX|nr:hypothetical protein TNCV_673051 [Trichonephila clavipes]
MIVREIVEQVLHMQFCGMIRRAAAKFIPKLLSVEQKEHRLGVVQDLLNTSDDEPGSLRLLTVPKNENAS